MSDSGATVVLSNGRLLFTNILTLNVVTIANVTGDLSGAVNTPLQNVIDNTSATSKLIIRNLEARGFGEFVNTGGVAVAVGMINVSSNLANDAAMTSEYTTLGYTQEANTLVPTFV